MTAAHRVLRQRDGRHARVTNEELFFDLVYVFAVTQLSHFLLARLTPLGALQALLLWFAVWLGWQYTCWVTNWFEPRALPIRLLLFALMLVALPMAAALPHAFEGGGPVFAACFAAMQAGRTLVVLLHLGGTHALAANFRRILGWVMISGALWIAGAFCAGAARLALWAAAVACDYVSPMFGFRLPGLGRSLPSDWTIEGGHLAERCQLFVIVALGESIVVTGATLAGHGHWDAPRLVAYAVAFVGAAAMWWLYFDTGSEAGTAAITRADEPGRIGARFHYVHVILVGGVIVAAVGNELTLAHPDGHVTVKYALVLIGAPAVYLAGNALYKRIVHGRFPLSHLAGLAALAALLPLAFMTDLLMVNGLTTALLVVVAGWESRSRRGVTR